MPLALVDIQRITLEGLRRVHAGYVPAHKRYAFSASPEPEYDGRLVVEKDLFVCSAVMTYDQFQELRDYVNGLGVWLTAHWKPFGRVANKFYYDLAATRLIERAEWTKRRSDNTVRCTIELIGEDPRNPTQGIVEVVRAPADQLEAKARLNGHGPAKYQLIVEGELTRGRASVRRQFDTETGEYATEVTSSPKRSEAVIGPRPPSKAEAAGDWIPPVVGNSQAPLDPTAPREPAPVVRWHTRPYGSGGCLGFVVELDP